MSGQVAPTGPGVVPGRTPDWLLTAERSTSPGGRVGRRRRRSFVESTLTGGADLLRQVMFNQDVAAGPGLLQRVDARVKLVSLIVLLVAVGLVHHVGVLVVAYLCTFALAVASRFPLASFLRRVWLFVPVFTGVVVLPATLSIVMPGDVVLALWSWDGTPQGFTAQGLTSAALLVTRVATSISLVVLVTVTTPWNRLLAALRYLGVPRMFVMIIGMAYRFVFVLLGAVTDMYQSRTARTVGVQAHDRGARAFLSASTGHLFGTAHHLSEEVHQAMVARGYRGETHVLTAFRLASLDAVAACVVSVTAIAIYGADVLLGR